MGVIVWMVPSWDDVPLLYKDRGVAATILYKKAKEISDGVNAAYAAVGKGPQCTPETYLEQPVAVEIK